MLGILLYVKIRYILLVSDLLQIEDDCSSADEGRKVYYNDLTVCLKGNIVIYCKR